MMKNYSFVTYLKEITEEDNLNNSTKLDDLENWDSLRMLMVITEIDEKFDIEISGSDLSKCETIKDLLRLIEI